MNNTKIDNKEHGRKGVNFLSFPGASFILPASRTNGERESERDGMESKNEKKLKFQSVLGMNKQTKKKLKFLFWIYRLSQAPGVGTLGFSENDNFFS